jgi:hypothetical protein
MTPVIVTTVWIWIWPTFCDRVGSLSGVSWRLVDHAGVIMSRRVVIMVMCGFCCRTWQTW